MQATTLSSEALHHLQLDLACVRVAPDNVLTRLPCANPDDIARFIVADYGLTYACYYRADLPPSVRMALAALPPAQAFTEHMSVQQILAQAGPYTEVTTFKSYTFPPIPAATLSPHVTRWHALNHLGKPVFGIVQAGRLVAACESARENDACAEAWVWTHADFRRRGYARQATAAWAYDLQRQGKIPFYSYKISNIASQAVAHSLGLHPFMTVVGYS